MKKLFTEPVMKIAVFNVENIVTDSTGTQVSPGAVSPDTHLTATADWNSESDTLTFTF